MKKILIFLFVICACFTINTVNAESLVINNNTDVKVVLVDNDTNNGLYNNITNVPQYENRDEYCSPLGILKDDIQNIFNIFKIIAPILVIVMSIYDFIKAFTGKVEGDMKKAFTKLVKRLVFSVILFFLPDLLDFFLGLVDPGYNTCVK